MSTWTFTTASRTVTLSVGVSADEERGAGAIFAWYRHLGISGRDGYKVGADGRSWTVVALIEVTASPSENTLATALEALSTAALAAEVGTLAVRAQSTPYSNVILAAAPELLAHIPLQPGSTAIAQLVRLRFEQLEP